MKPTDALSNPVYLNIALFKTNELLDLVRQGEVYIKVHHLVVTQPVYFRFYRPRPNYYWPPPPIKYANGLVVKLKQIQASNPFIVLKILSF